MIKLFRLVFLSIPIMLAATNLKAADDYVLEGGVIDFADLQSRQIVVNDLTYYLALDLVVEKGQNKETDFAIRAGKQVEEMSYRFVDDADGYQRVVVYYIKLVDK